MNIRSLCYFNIKDGWNNYQRLIRDGLWHRCHPEILGHPYLVWTVRPQATRLKGDTSNKYGNEILDQWLESITDERFWDELKPRSHRELDWKQKLTTIELTPKRLLGKEQNLRSFNLRVTDLLLYRDWTSKMVRRQEKPREDSSWEKKGVPSVILIKCPSVLSLKIQVNPCKTLHSDRTPYHPILHILRECPYEIDTLGLSSFRNH